jgi:signal transduction histidine kinase
MNSPEPGSDPRSRRVVVLAVMALVLIAIVQAQWWIIELAQADPEAGDAARLRGFALEASFLLTVLAAVLAGIASGYLTELQIRRRQDSFLALVSHQFKTPLASLKLAIESLLLRPDLPEQASRAVGRAHDDVQRLENLIANVLESARLDEGRVTLAADRLPLARFVAQVVDRLSERATRAGARINVRIAPELAVLADPVAADAVLRNVLENSIAAVAPRGDGRIEVTATRDGDRIHVDIVDDGVGFDMADSRRLFEKFGRADPAYRSSERTGLGLNIAKRLMQLGGGRISAYSPGLGRGASFRLVWPSAGTDSP